MQDKFPLFGVPFSTLSRPALRAAVIKRSDQGLGTSVLFANAHVVVEASRLQNLHTLLTQADLVVPDGVPISWVLKAKGQSSAQRYSGPDFMEDLFGETQNKRHFFLGSTEETLSKIKAKFKGSAAGFYSPPFSSVGFSEDELKKQMDLIDKSQADFIWVGLGAPKQEQYTVEMASRAKKGVWLAVGAAFDFYAGNKPRAPKFLQNLGLEWAFRMATEPRRLASRYLDTNPKFVQMALKEVLKGKKS